MNAKRRPPPAAPRPAPPPPRGGRVRDQQPPNPLTQPDARWQRTQRYVWDKKRG